MGSFFLSGIVLFSLWPLTKENKNLDKTLSYSSQICDLQLSYNNLMQKLSCLKRLRNFSLSVTELIEKKTMYELKVGCLKKIFLKRLKHFKKKNLPICQFFQICIELKKYQAETFSLRKSWLQCDVIFVQWRYQLFCILLGKFCN